MRSSFVLVLVSVVACGAFAYNNGLPPGPPLGWSTWCVSMTQPSQDEICGLPDLCSAAEVMQQAQALVSTGMRDAGYKLIQLDDCWAAATRNASGYLEADPTRFPDGMKALADYLHELNLTLGLYTCIGTETCRNALPGSFGYYDKDAEQFAAWGVDYVKCDNCARPGQYTERQLFTNFSHYLNVSGAKAGRPIWFATCEWGDENITAWGATVAQSFRIGMDHLPLYDLGTKAAGMGDGQGTGQIIEYMASIRPSTFVRPWGYGDADFLHTMFAIDLFGDKIQVMTYKQSATEFSMWAMWASNMIVDTSLVNMTQEMLSILLNTEVIAVQQDPTYTGADRLFKNADNTQVWSRKLANGDVAVVLLNNDYFGANGTWTEGGSHAVELSWSQLGWAADAVVSARDLWAHASLGNITGGFTTPVLEPAESMMLRLTCVAGC